MPTHSTSHSRNPSTSTTMTTATAATTANTTLATGATDLQRKISYRKPAPSYYQPSTAEVVPPVPSNPNMSARARTPSYASSVSQEGVANLKRAASATPSLAPPRPPRSFERPVSPNAPPARKVDQAVLDRESPLDVHVRDVQGRRDSFQLYAAPRRPTKLDKPQNTAYPAPETQPPVVSVRPAKVVPHAKAVKPEPRLMPFPPPAKPVSFFELPIGSGSNSSLPSTNSHSYHYAKAAPSPSLVPSLPYQQVTRRPSFPPPVHFADPRERQSRYERKGSPSGGREKFERVALDRHEPRAKVPRHSSSWASILCCVVPSIDMEDEPQSRRSSTQVQVRQSWGSSAGLLPGKGVRAAEVEVEDRWRGMGLPERRHPESYLGKKGSKHWQDDYSRQPRY